MKEWIDNHRELILIVFVLPIGKIMSLIAKIKYKFNSPKISEHDNRVKRIQEEILANADSNKPMRMNRMGHETLETRSSDKSKSTIIQVKDIFVFCCFTGLAYADVKKLHENDVVIGIDGERWIKTKRTKTDTRSNIPMLPTAAAILEKYAEHPDIQNGLKLLPVLSNQKMNAYLKEIADVFNITKNLTFHLARHTFATTVTLTNGVPIESVSKMLGHKSLKTAS